MFLSMFYIHIYMFIIYLYINLYFTTKICKKSIATIIILTYSMFKYLRIDNDQLRDALW